MESICPCCEGPYVLCEGCAGMTPADLEDFSDDYCCKRRLEGDPVQAAAAEVARVTQELDEVALRLQRALGALVVAQQGQAQPQPLDPIELMRAELKDAAALGGTYEPPMAPTDHRSPTDVVTDMHPSSVVAQWYAWKVP